MTAFNNIFIEINHLTEKLAVTVIKRVNPAISVLIAIKFLDS
jgi:hypothetical protein